MTDRTTRYDGRIGTARLFWEVFAEMPGAARSWLSDTVAKARGEADIGETCGFDGCDGHGVATMDHPDYSYRELALCRRHWALTAAFRSAVTAIFIALILVLYVLLVYSVVVWG